MITEYEKAMYFLKNGCNCGYSNKILKKEFAELRENFQALTKPEQDVFLIAQLRSMDGGVINTSQCFKKKLQVNKRTSYH